MRLRAAGPLAILMFAAAPSPAAEAQASEAEVGTDDEARALFERARAAYGRELFTEAEDGFVAAFEAMPADDPRRTLILANVAQAIERQGGRDEDALAAWKRFEQEARDIADAEPLLRASQRIRELEARLARRGRGATDEAGKSETDAKETDGAELDLAIDANVVEAPEARRRPHASGIALASAGGAMVLVGGIVGVLSLTKRNSILDECAGTQCPESARRDARGVERLSLASDGLLWPGLALTAAGAVLMFTVPSRKDRRVSASCGVTGCSLSGSF